MTRMAPSWVRSAEPTTGARANAIMAKGVALDRLRLRGAGDLPTDQDSARRELTEEQRALRSPLAFCKVSAKGF